jgi:inner membrane protein
MTLAILIPLMMIRGVINERQTYRLDAVREVARSYAGPQAFSGPVLVVPYTETVEVEEKDADGKMRTVVRDEAHQWVFFPENLDVRGQLRPDTRRLGLHEVRVYEWEAAAKAKFNAEIPVDESGDHNRRIGQAWLSYGIADVRGLLAPPRMQLNGKPREIEDGLGHGSGAGVHVRLAAPEPGEVLMLDARLDFTLGGTESLSLVPLGKHNDFAIDSTWRHPRFSGSFLPRSHDIDGDGFSANWQVASVATNAQRQYLGGDRLPMTGLDDTDALRYSEHSGPLDAVKLSLVEPVNVYSQADRATKYGLLFVLLTFVGFFIFELVKHLPIHPIQYGLVGLALAIFFLLLVSLSEHIAFAWAYLIASVACIGLLGFYLSAVLRSVARGMGFAGMLAMLYAALYGLLVSEDNALVLGSALLFVILAGLMVVTRKVDWYQLAGRTAVRG